MPGKTVVDALVHISHQLVESKLWHAEDGHGLNNTLSQLLCTGRSDWLMPDNLPPLLLHEDSRPSADKLYGVSSSNVPRAAYKHLDAAKDILETGMSVLGALTLDVCDGKHPPVPVLLLLVEKRLVALMLDAPLAAFESELFAADKPTKVEVDVRGGINLATALSSLRTAIGESLRDGSMHNLPQFLLTGTFQVTRTNVLPFLRLRPPADDFEHVQCDAVIAWALAQISELGNKPFVCSSGHSLNYIESCEFVFTSAPSKHGEYMAKLSSEAVAKATRENTLAEAVKEALFCDKDHVVGRVAEAVANIVAGPLQTDETRIALPTAAQRYIEKQSNTQSVAPEMTVLISSNGRGPLTLDKFLHACPGTTMPMHVKLQHMSAACVGGLACKLFAPNDQLLASRDVSWECEDTTRGLRGLVFNMARRVSPECAVMILPRGKNNVINPAAVRLVNFDTNTAVSQVDAIARLLTFSWITPIFVPTDDSSDTVVLLQQPLLHRKQLRVADGVHKHKHTITPPTSNLSTELEVMRRTMSDLTNALRNAQEQKVDAPPPCTTTKLLLDVASELEKRMQRKRALDAK